MNDLLALQAMESAGQLTGGQVVFFFGKGAVSSIIEHTQGYLVNPGGVKVDGPSHVGIVFSRLLSVNNVPQTEPWILESSITTDDDGKERSGPQLNKLGWRIQHYDQDARIYVAEFADRIKTLLDWTALWTAMMAKVGPDSYAKAELVEYVLRRWPVIGNLPWIYRPHATSEVCSDYLAQGLRAGGWPGLVPPLVTPSVLVSMAAYKSITQICGPTMAIEGANTI